MSVLCPVTGTFEMARKVSDDFLVHAVDGRKQMQVGRVGVAAGPDQFQFSVRASEIGKLIDLVRSSPLTGAPAFHGRFHLAKRSWK